ncbi:MAG TPA: multidrug transporter subunit MdtD [Steroidobacteraceae bacterium]|nr:multidrug transporter subunit MdtD [Steroidobacteraceae bacterium]
MERFSRSEYQLLWLVAAGFFMQTLDSTIVTTALPAMAISLHESPLRMQSVIIAYTLTMAMLIPASGWLADRLGTRTTFFCAIAVFVLGSALCAASSTLRALALSRIVQGAGGSMLLPVGRLAVLRNVPPQRYLPALALVTIPGLVGPLIGPTAGGWLSEYYSWHWIFLINIPVGVVGAVLTLRIMPQTRGVRRDAFDLVGYSMIAVAMLAISLALDGLAELHLQHALVLVLFVFGLAALSAYWLHASQRPRPLFTPQLFRVASFSIGLLGNLFSRIGSGAVPFLLPLTLQIGLGYTPLQSGLMMVPAAVAAMLTKRPVTPLIMRHGYRRVLMANTLLLGAAIASLGLVGPGEPLWLRIIQFALFGAVNSLQFTAMNTLTLKDLGAERASSGNSLLSMVQMVSMSFGVAAAAALLTTFTQMLGAVRPLQVLRAFHLSFLCAGCITVAATWVFSQLSGELPSRGEREREREVDVAPS